MEEFLRGVLKSQYHATLAMLRDAIAKCPAALWSGADHVNPAWRVAYHVLYYTHFYLQPTATSFRPWVHHQTGIQYMDDWEPPAEFAHIGELPERPPRTGQPYTKEQILEYWNFCDQLIDQAIDGLDLASSESGFFWYKVPKIEHQIINLRHLQHHLAQLGERIRAAAGPGIEWVGSRRSV